MITVSFPDWDQELFMYLNSKNTPWLDPIMILLSTYTAWFALCILIIVFMIWKKQKEGALAGFFLMCGVTMNTVLNLLVKALFMRPRPGHEETLQDLFRQLEEVGNGYSFFSAHSSNSICLAVFTTLWFRNKLYGIAIFAWALAVAYSRIYVGKHYPLDVLVGILFGLLTGWISYWLYRKYALTNAPVEENPLSPE